MSEPAREPLAYATPTPAPRSRRRIAVFIALFVLVFLIGVAVPIVIFTARTVRYTAVGTVTVVPRPLAPPTTPARITLVQRSAQTLPGTGGAAIARIGDITGGQVLVTIEDLARQPILNTVSMKQGEVQPFTIAGSTFVIQLIELKNFLTGDDFAVFEIRRAEATTAAALSEAEKIDRLIDAVARAEGLTFIRNGSAHSAADAADHLRRKYKSTDDGSLTARQFIEHIASRSSLSGRSYRVRLPDGEEKPANEWLTARLVEVEASASTQRSER